MKKTLWRKELWLLCWVDVLASTENRNSPHITGRNVVCTRHLQWSLFVKPPHDCFHLCFTKGKQSHQLLGRKEKALGGSKGDKTYAEVVKTLGRMRPREKLCGRQQWGAMREMLCCGWEARWQCRTCCSAPLCVHMGGGGEKETDLTWQQGVLCQRKAETK